MQGLITTIKMNHLPAIHVQVTAFITIGMPNCRLDKNVGERIIARKLEGYTRPL